VHHKLLINSVIEVQVSWYPEKMFTLSPPITLGQPLLSVLIVIYEYNLQSNGIPMCTAK